VQYIFVALTDPFPRKRVALINNKDWYRRVFDTYAKRTSVAKDDKRDSRICVVQLEVVYDILNGVDVATAPEKWEILFVTSVAD